MNWLIDKLIDLFIDWHCLSRCVLDVNFSCFSQPSKITPAVFNLSDWVSTLLVIASDLSSWMPSISLLCGLLSILHHRIFLAGDKTPFWSVPELWKKEKKKSCSRRPGVHSRCLNKVTASTVFGILRATSAKMYRDICLAGRRSISRLLCSLYVHPPPLRKHVSAAARDAGLSLVL